MLTGPDIGRGIVELPLTDVDPITRAHVEQLISMAHLDAAGIQVLSINHTIKINQYQTIQIVTRSINQSIN